MTTEEEIQWEWELWVRSNFSSARAEFTIQCDRIDRRYDRQSGVGRYSHKNVSRQWTSKQTRRARKQKNKYRGRILGEHF